MPEEKISLFIKVKEKFEKLKLYQKILFILSALFIFHILLFYYTEGLNLLFELKKNSALNIGIIGDSLAVLSFGLLAYSLLQTSKELRLNRKGMQENIKEAKASRKEAEESNRIRFECEVMENIRAIIYNIPEESNDYKKTEWLNSPKNAVIRLNLTNLIKNHPATLETLVQIRREEDNELLKDFAQQVIDKNKYKLSGLKFPERIDLIGAELQGAYLSGADLQGAILFMANLQEADLSGAELQGADLSEADLSDAKLQGADLIGAELENALLCEADLKDTKNLTPEQLSKTFSLYRVKNLDTDLEKEIKEKYPHLLEPNDEVIECNDEGKGILFYEYIRQ